MKSMFSAVFSPLGLFTGPAGNKRERKDSVRSPTESVGSSSSASGTIPASPLSPASSTSLPSPLSAFSADFAAIDDVVIDRAGNLFWKDPMSGVRTPVKEEEDAEVRKRLRVRLLACMLEVSQAEFTDDERRTLGLELLPPAPTLSSSSGSAAPPSSSTEIQIHPNVLRWQSIDRLFELAESWAPASARPRVRFLRDSAEVLYRLATDEGTLRNLVRALLGMISDRLGLWRARSAVTGRATSMMHELLASLTTEDVASLFTRRISFDDFVERQLIGAALSPTPAIESAPVPPPPPPPPPPSLSLPPPPPPPPPPMPGLHLPPLAAGISFNPTLPRGAPSMPIRNTDSSATLSSDPPTLRHAASMSSLGKKQSSSLSFDEELQQRVLSRRAPSSEWKSPTTLKRQEKTVAGTPKHAVDEMKRRILARRESFRMSDSESEEEVDRWEVSKKATVVGKKRKVVVQAAGEQDATMLGELLKGLAVSEVDVGTEQ